MSWLCAITVKSVIISVAQTKVLSHWKIATCMTSYSKLGQLLRQCRSSSQNIGHTVPTSALTKALSQWNRRTVSLSFCQTNRINGGGKFGHVVIQIHLTDLIFCPSSRIWGRKHTTVSKNGLFFDVVQELTKPMHGSNVRLYTDSAYSSIKTFLYLKKHSIFASGTCRQNILGLHPSVKNAPKWMPWGSQRIFQDENDRFLTCCLWFDTKPC